MDFDLGTTNEKQINKKPEIGLLGAQESSNSDSIPRYFVGLLR